MKKYFCLSCSLWMLLVHIGKAQDSSRILFNTGAGFISGNKFLRKALKPSLAFNSAIEFVTEKKIFAQATIGFNSLKYDQQIKDESSPYLFQGTSSSLLMIGLNGGRNFKPDAKNWITSLYAGGGYISIGEPRVALYENTITQNIEQKKGAFVKGGARLAYTTKIKLFQTLYADASWWSANQKVQGAKLSGWSFFAGTQMSMK